MPTDFSVELKTGQQFQGWVVGEKLGQGGFGSVYSVSKGDEVAAIKASYNDLTTRNEAEVLKKLSALVQDRKPFPEFLSSSFDCSSRSPIHYLIMSIEGLPLDVLLQRSPTKSFSVSRALTVLCCGVEALRSLFLFKIVHRDLKPANFLVGRSEDRATVCLSDFGLCTTLSGKGPRLEMRVLPKFRYSSVDVMNGLPYWYKDDLMALLFVVLSLAGERGFAHDDIEVRRKTKCALMEDAKIISKVNKELREAAEWICEMPRATKTGKPFRPDTTELLAIIKKCPHYQENVIWI